MKCWNKSGLVTVCDIRNASNIINCTIQSKSFPLQVELRTFDELWKIMQKILLWSLSVILKQFCLTNWTEITGFLTALQYSTFGTEITPMTMFIVNHHARPMGEFTRFIRWMQTMCQVAANPQNKPTNLGCESVCNLPPSTPTVAVYYYYSAQRLTLMYHPTEGRRLSQPRWLATYWDDLPAHRWSVVTHPSANWAWYRLACESTFPWISQSMISSFLCIVLGSSDRSETSR